MCEPNNALIKLEKEIIHQISEGDYSESFTETKYKDHMSARQKVSAKTFNYQNYKSSSERFVVCKS